MAKLDDLKKRKAQLEARIQMTEAREKVRARKRRTRELIEIGGLAEIAGVRDFDRGALLGALLVVRKMAEADPKRAQDWKLNGDALLKARQTEREHRKKR